ncbi:MAG: TatD family hydrolase [Planctomycetaceae bacterium]|nr:TatD family hydrolase [Planctomycetaceae bacterium]
MNLIDTHAHLTYDELLSQIDAVIQRSVDAGVTGWITIGTDRAQCAQALQLAARLPNMYAGLGFHPHYANDIKDDDLQYLRQVCDDPLVKAIGETGLDYHYDNCVKENQARLFRAHLEIAAQVNKPVIIHTRNAFDDSMDILDEYRERLKRVVIHCYGGDASQTQRVLDRGYYISFTGTVTFKKSDALREVAKTIPLDRLMIESDCPFISPEPVRRQQPNEPALIVHTARCLADLHVLPLEDFAEKITHTSKRFFELD